MEDRRTISLALQQGERKQILLETGTTLVVAAGHIVLRLPMLWLAENTVARETVLKAEEAWVAEHSGWIDLEARSTVRLAILPHDSVPFWRLIGRSLGTIFGANQTAEPKPDKGADAVLKQRL